VRRSLVPVVALSCLAADQAPSRNTNVVRVELKVGWEWLPMAGGRSALRIRRALDPAGRPYDASLTALGCQPADLRRSFQLPKNDYLLGEPLIVEMRISLEGPGIWREPVGGNYRAHGRDDNFAFLLRREDGTFVPDPYAPFEGLGGGLSSTYPVQQGAPGSHWLAVQRWAAIDRAGTYELFAFQFAHDRELGLSQALAVQAPLHDAGVSQLHPRLIEEPTPSPLEASLPHDVRSRLGERSAIVQDFAHFRVTIRAGSATAIAAMIARVRSEAKQFTESVRASRADATRAAIWFARQEMFLPTLAEWIHTRDAAYYMAGLAMNPSPRATKLLLADRSQEAINALHYLPSSRVRDAIPELIERLDDSSDSIRSLAEQHLKRWTGQSFGHTWEGYQLGRPTLEEAPAVKSEWRRWWSEHATNWQPTQK
jgi:hypothetical protein